VHKKLKERKEETMSTEEFNPQHSLKLYRELNKAEDDLTRQDRLQDARSIHLRCSELEQEAKRNGYTLTVRWDSIFCSDDEEICFIEKEAVA
jgi:hypothetical protein